MLERSEQDVVQALDDRLDVFLDHPVELEGLASRQPDHVAAMRAGKHVLQEKPLATSREDAEALVTIASETGVQVAVLYTIETRTEEQRDAGIGYEDPAEIQEAIDRAEAELRFRAHAAFGLLNSTPHSARIPGRRPAGGTVRGILEDMAWSSLMS